MGLLQNLASTISPKRVSTRRPCGEFRTQTVQDHLGVFFQKTGRLETAAGSLGTRRRGMELTVPAGVETDLLVATKRSSTPPRYDWPRKTPRTSKAIPSTSPEYEQDDSFSVPGTRNSVLLPVKLPACWPATPCKWNFPRTPLPEPPIPIATTTSAIVIASSTPAPFAAWVDKTQVFQRAAIPTTSATGSRTHL